MRPSTLPWRRRAPTTALWATLLALAGSDCTCGTPAEPCLPGETTVCPCGDGRQSFQTCKGDGTSFSECACDVAKDAVRLGLEPAVAALVLENLAPGDEQTRPIVVRNDGARRLRYAVRSATTEDTLAARLALRVVASPDGACTAPGATLYGPAPLGSTSGINLVGDPLQGEQPGDRELRPETSEVLCFTVQLPLDAGNELQGLSTSAAFAFVAEQTAGNP